MARTPVGPAISAGHLDERSHAAGASGGTAQLSIDRFACGPHSGSRQHFRAVSAENRAGSLEFLFHDDGVRHRGGHNPGGTDAGVLLPCQPGNRGRVARTLTITSDVIDYGFSPCHRYLVYFVNETRHLPCSGPSAAGPAAHSRAAGLKAIRRLKAIWDCGRLA